MHRKGQVTVFVILGVVLIIAFGLVYSMYSKSKGTTRMVPEDIDTFKILAEQCLSTASKSVIEKVHAQGGYYIIDYGKSAYINEYTVPYYSYSGIIDIPTETEIAVEISEGIKIEFEPCMDSGIPKYTEMGWKIERSKLNPETKITTDDTASNTVIMITAEYPTKLSRGESTYTIGKISYTSDSRLGLFLKAATACTNEWSKYPGWFNMNCIIEDKDYYTITDWRQEDTFSYFEYQDMIAKQEGREVFWRFALIP